MGEQVESLFDEALPIEVRELPPDLARLDGLLSDPALLAPIAACWEAAGRDRGRPTIAMSLFVRLMVVKQRSGWGYETLVREVSDSLHLRRFCGLSLTASVPHESTVRKLVRRLGADVVDELTRALVAKSTRERRFSVRAMRCDSTVVEADVRWPSDAGLAVDATRLLAREGARAAAVVGASAHRVRDRSRAAGRRLRLIGRTVGRRLGQTGGVRQQVLALTDEAGELVRRSVREARRLAAQARASARGRGAQRKLAAARRLEEAADRAEAIVSQIKKRLAGERITDRVVSLADPDARPIGKGKLGKRYEFGYVFQLAELTPNTRRGARGLILPAASRIGSPNESELLPATVAELARLRLKPREAAFDGGFPVEAANAALPDCAVFIAGQQQPSSRRPRKRLASYRVGCEGRISHLKRSYGMRRSRLRGHAGARTWVGWAILTYNLDTLAVQTT
ncbi:MAG TPA: transposase [Solirubrobacterales bacterium]|nr:transposase [Solirubrobacterales bacterium]